MNWLRVESACLYLLFAFMLAVVSMGPPYHRIRVGDPCGPEHQWVLVGMGMNQDYSCEPKRLE